MIDVARLDGVIGKRVPDAEIAAAYNRLRSVHRVAKEVGLNHSSVHERLVRLGLNTPQPVFTDEERERLKREYLIYRNAGKLRDLARLMGRTVPSLCRVAGTLGLTDRGYAKMWSGKWKYMTEDTARVLFERYRRQRETVRTFCRRAGFDELGFARTLRRFFPDEWEIEVEAHQPKQTLYRYGRQFEYRVRDQLREFGFFCLRSPRSLSPLDLVAIKPGAVLFVQCKRNGELGVNGWNALLDLSRSVGAIPLLAEVAPARGHILYWRLLEKKDGTKRAQPRGAFLPDNV